MDQDSKKSKEYIKQLSKKKKIEWFLQYHAWKIAVPLLAIVIGSYIITSYQKETKEILVSIAMVNAKMEQFSDITFQKEYEQERKQTGLPVKLYAELTYKESEVGLDTFTVASMQKYSNLLVNGDIDVTIADEKMITNYEKADGYYNLDSILPDSLKKQYADDYYYAKNSKGESIPVGIRIKENKKVSNFYKEPPILTISSRTQRKEEAIQFVEWFLR